VLAAEAQRSRRQVRLIEARQAVAVATAELCRLVGLPLDTAVEPTSPLEAAPLPLEPLDALIARAAAARPERRALAARAAAARARAAAAEAAGRPSVDLAAGVDYARPNPRIFPRRATWEDSWDVSIAGAWTLFDGGRRAAERAEASAAARAAEAALGEFDSRLALEIRRRRLDLEAARAAVRAASDGVRAAIEARRVLAERYRAGVATSAEVLDAEVAALEAELERTRALANVRLAEAALERAVGR